jgi:hypothetical protein
MQTIREKTLSESNILHLESPQHKYAKKRHVNCYMKDENFRPLYVTKTRLFYVT